MAERVAVGERVGVDVAVAVRVIAAPHEASAHATHQPAELTRWHCCQRPGFEARTGFELLMQSVAPPHANDSHDVNIVALENGVNPGEHATQELSHEGAGGEQTPHVAVTHAAQATWPPSRHTGFTPDLQHTPPAPEHPVQSAIPRQKLTYGGDTVADVVGDGVARAVGALPTCTGVAVAELVTPAHR